MKFSSQEIGAEHWYQRERHDRCAKHGESLCEGERVKQFSFLTSQREDGNECQNDDCHGEEDRSADQFCRVFDRFEYPLSIFWIDLSLFQKAKGILSNHN